MGKLITTGFLALFLSLSLSSAWAVDAKVNLNKASAEVLAESLSGIGLTKAQAIVAWRDQNGQFDSLDELLAVKGVGETLVAKNKDRIVLK